MTLKDFTPEEILYMVDLAAELKDKKKKGILTTDMHAGKNIALIFEKTSTRTRCSFEVAAHDLGMGTTYLDPSGSQIGKKKALPIQQESLEECLTVLNIVVLDRKLWKNLQNMQEFLCGTVLPTNTILHRC